MMKGATQKRVYLAAPPPAPRGTLRYPDHSHLTWLQWTIATISYCITTSVPLKTLFIKSKGCTVKGYTTVQSLMKLAVHYPWIQEIPLERNHWKA